MNKNETINETLTINFNVNFNLPDEVKRLIQFLGKLNQTGVKIMKDVAEFAASQKEINSKIDASLKGIGEDLKGLSEVIATLKASSNSNTALSEEDKASLAALSDYSKSLDEKLAAMDAMNPAKTPENPETPQDPQDPTAPQDPATPEAPAAPAEPAA